MHSIPLLLRLSHHVVYDDGQLIWIDGGYIIWKFSRRMYYYRFPAVLIMISTIWTDNLFGLPVKKIAENLHSAKFLKKYPFQSYQSYQRRQIEKTEGCHARYFLLAPKYILVFRIDFSCQMTHEFDYSIIHRCVCIAVFPPFLQNVA